MHKQDKGTYTELATNHYQVMELLKAAAIVYKQGLMDIFVEIMREILHLTEGEAYYGPELQYYCGKFAVMLSNWVGGRDQGRMLVDRRCLKDVKHAVDMMAHDVTNGAWRARLEATAHLIEMLLNGKQKEAN